VILQEQDRQQIREQDRIDPQGTVTPQPPFESQNPWKLEMAGPGGAYDGGPGAGSSCVEAPQQHRDGPNPGHRQENGDIHGDGGQP